MKFGIGCLHQNLSGKFDFGLLQCDRKLPCKEDEVDVGGSNSIYGEMRNPYKTLVEKPQGERPIGRPKCR